LRITQLYYPSGKSDPDWVYGYDKILADLDRLLTETKRPEVGAREIWAPISTFWRAS
jgi:hypothetical protein